MRQKENKKNTGRNVCKGHNNCRKFTPKHEKDEEFEKIFRCLCEDESDDEDDDEDVSDDDFEVPTDDFLSEYAIDSMDIEAFTKGVEDVSELCGKISALTSVGIEPGQALAYLSNVQDGEISYKNNVEIAKIQADAQKDASKTNFMRTMD